MFGKILHIRSDSYLNITDICIQANRCLDDWLRYKSSKKLIKSYQLKINGRTNNKCILEIEKQKNICWAIPELAVRILMWCYPNILASTIQNYVRNYINLHICQTVSLNKQKIINLINDNNPVKFKLLDELEEIDIKIYQLRCVLLLCS